MTKLDLEALGLTAEQILNTQPMREAIGSQVAMKLAQDILSVQPMPDDVLSNLYNALEPGKSYIFSVREE